MAPDNVTTSAEAGGRISDPKPKLLILDDDVLSLKSFTARYAAHGFEVIPCLAVNDESSLETMAHANFQVAGLFRDASSFHDMIKSLDFDAVLSDSQMITPPPHESGKKSYFWGLDAAKEVLLQKPCMPFVIHSTMYGLDPEYDVFWKAREEDRLKLQALGGTNTFPKKGAEEQVVAALKEAIAERAKGLKKG